MGIMTKRSAGDRRRLARWGAIGVVALFVWSFVAAPGALTAEDEVEEPASLSAYDTQADAAPILGLLDHQTYLIPIGSAIAHSTSEVSQPSAAGATAWLVDLGIANGLHGTTTGNKVPTEATASQPGGSAAEEFVLTNEPAGNESTIRYGAGVSRATAEHSERPRGFAHSFLANLVVLPAPGSPDQPPGTYDPAGDAAKEQEHPGPVPSGSPTPDDPKAYTPNPRGQMAILAIGSVASSSETIREEGKVISIAVAELSGINIGNRTADNRCANCITIDSMRIEARAESDGTKEGALAAWRILIHRACRVAIANDPVTGAAFEQVRCLDPNPDGIIEARDEESFAEAFEDPNARGVRKIETLEGLNTAFAAIAQGLGTKDLGITVHFATQKDNKATLSPDGQEADAVARGIFFEVTSAVASEKVNQAAQSEKDLIAAGDQACGQINAGIPPNANASAPCPSGVVNTAAARKVVRLTLGQVTASVKATPSFGVPTSGEETGGVVGIPEIKIPEFNIPSFEIPAAGGGGSTTIVQGGLRGPLKVKVDWSSIRVKPWKPKDMAKGFFAGGLVAAMIWAVRRRLRLG
jgi:hypothetical protein